MKIVFHWCIALTVAAALWSSQSALAAQSCRNNCKQLPCINAQIKANVDMRNTYNWLSKHSVSDADYAQMEDAAAGIANQTKDASCKVHFKPKGIDPNAFRQMFINAGFKIESDGSWNDTVLTDMNACVVRQGPQGLAVLKKFLACPELAEFVYEHENAHVMQCTARKLIAQTQRSPAPSQTLTDNQLRARDEVEAYDRELKLLRQMRNQMKYSCQKEPPLPEAAQQVLDRIEKALAKLRT